MKYTLSIFGLGLALAVPALAAQYYVSNSGADSNSGTSPATPWKTLGQVNAQAFNPGDTIYLQRGGVWNEPLVPLSSGSSGSPIAFDAYGTGPAPVITAAAPIPFAGGSWSYVSGNTWKASIPSTIGSPTVNLVQFGSVYGRKQPYGSGCPSSIVSKYDWCLSWPSLYVYSPAGTNPVATYMSDGSIVPIVGQASGLALISVVNKKWLTFQHIKIQNFDYMGVSVTGSSDNLMFANMESDGMAPYGTTPHGFYVNAPNATSIQFANDDAHLNYDGFRVDGATAVAVTNCRGYANRDAGLKDNTGKMTYAYSHFYGNNVAQFPTSDVVGGIAGNGNVSSAIAPVVTNFQRYPARFSFTVDDVGSSAGTEGYINSFLTLFSSRGIHFNAAVVPSYTVDWGSVNTWYSGGNEIDSHSWSHQYYTTNLSPGNSPPYPNAPALDIQYAGGGTAATLTISGNVLSTAVTGASGDNLSVNLGSYTMQGLHDYLASLSHYTVTYDVSGPLVRPNTHSINLLNVSGQDIKTSAFVLLYDQTRLVPDEMVSAKTAIQANVAGLTESFYVYPDGIEDPTTEADAVAGGYTAARGSLAMKGQDNTTGSANSLYSNGVNVENITSLGAMQIHGLTQAQINQMVASLVFRAQAWGAPYGFFTHYNSRGDSTPDISNTELGYLLDAVSANGGLWLTNTALASAITSGSGFSGTTRWIQAASGAAVNLAVAGANSPTVGRAAATAYPVDLNGVNRTVLATWDIGSSAYVSQRYGTGSGSGSTYIGGATYLSAAQLPQRWANDLEVNPPNGTYDVTRTASTFAQMQQAICDWVVAPDQWWLVQIPHGTVIDTVSAGYACTQNAGTNYQSITLLSKVVSGGVPTKFLVFDSDTPLLYQQTVCSHGITDPAGTRQPPSGDIATWWSGTNFGCANDRGAMWTLEGNWTPGNSGLLIQAGSWDAATNIGPSHYAFRNVEMRPIPSDTDHVFMVNSNPDPNNTGSLTLTSQMASHIHFVNIYGHGDGKDWCPAATGSGACVTSSNTGGPGNNHISAFMHLDRCLYCSVTYSYFDYITSAGGNESHVIGILETPGPLEVAHNWLSSSSSALFVGGVAATDPLYYADDIFVWQNRLTNPPSWIGTSYGGAGLLIKNRSEIKTCVRCLYEGNIAEYVDLSGAQQGQCFSENPRQCSANISCDNYQAAIADVTYSNNICRHALTGFMLIGRSLYPGDNGGGSAGPTRRLNLTNNLMYDLGNGPLLDPTHIVSFPYGMRADGNGEAFICNGTNASGMITLNCAAGPTGLLETQISPGDLVVVTNCSDATWNVPSGTYPSSKGATALPGTNPNGLTVIYSNPSAVSSTASGCLAQNFQGFPAALTFTHNTLVMQTTGGGRNNGREYAASSPNIWTDTGCGGGGPTNSTTITSLSRAGGIVTASVASTTGWQTSITASNSIEIVVEVLNSGDFTGTFYYLGQDGNGHLQWMQAGSPDETGATLGTVQQTGKCPASLFLQNATWKNNLFAFDVGTAPSCPGTPSTGWTGWVEQGTGVEGCPSGTSSNLCSENQVDVTNSVVANTDFPGRCGAKYMEVGGANAGAIPPATLTFPAGTVCAGSTADATCVGMVGMMNGAAFDANDANYHNYELAASSVYKAGAAYDADDSADLGANIPAIDNALTRFAYPCGNCGGGPVAMPPKVEILAPGAGASVAAVNTYLKPSPYINGIVYALWWSCSDQDGTAAHYTWSAFDNQVVSDGWAAAGKKIMVVLGGVTYGGSDNICYGGSGYGTSGVGNYGTPAYVWSALGASNSVACGGQQIPNYLNSAYLTHYQNWVAATLAHLAASSYASSIQYVRVAWGKGGETTPTANWDAAGSCPDGSGHNTLTNDWGYTLAGWESFLQGGMTYEAGLGSPLQLMISITPMGPSGGSQAAVPNFTAPIAASLHIGFGTQGLMASDVNNVAGCGGNWCSLFATYSGQVPLETQTFYQSCAAVNESGTCPSMAVTTGTLDPLLIWSAQQGTTTFEMYYEDACAMLCPGYAVAGYAGYPQAGYLGALMDVVGGVY